MATRLTKQQRIISDILEANDAPLSANDIYDAAKQSYPNIAKSTIYRNITALFEAEEIDRFFFSDSETYYQLRENRHRHYMFCEDCHHFFRTTECFFETISDSILKKSGFAVTHHFMQLSGTYSECQKKKS